MAQANPRRWIPGVGVTTNWVTKPACTSPLGRKHAHRVLALSSDKGRAYLPACFCRFSRVRRFAAQPELTSVDTRRSAAAIRIYGILQRRTIPQPDIACQTLRPASLLHRGV